MSDEVKGSVSDIGRVVRLKSGGPRMTVALDPKSCDLKCTWFTDTGVEGLLEHVFDRRVLDFIDEATRLSTSVPVCLVWLVFVHEHSDEGVVDCITTATDGAFASRSAASDDVAMRIGKLKEMRGTYDFPWTVTLEGGIAARWRCEDMSFTIEQREVTQ